MTEVLPTGHGPTVQHRLLTGEQRILGSCDGLEALRQTVWLILNTERYAYPIFSWNYGIELEDLYGKPVTLVCPELERRISEALSVDERIKSVDAFSFDTSRRGIAAVTFTVHSTFGSWDERIEVNF